MQAKTCRISRYIEDFYKKINLNSDSIKPEYAINYLSNDERVLSINKDIYDIISSLAIKYSIALRKTHDLKYPDTSLRHRLTRTNYMPIEDSSLFALLNNGAFENEIEDAAYFYITRDSKKNSEDDIKRWLENMQSIDKSGIIRKKK